MRNPQINILTAFLLLTLLGCNSKEIADLNSQIAEFKLENKKLKDSISHAELNRINHFSILGTTEEFPIKAGKDNEVEFLFAYHGPISEYDVYLLTGEDNSERELILENQKKASFKYNFIPKNRSDNKLKLMAVFKHNGSEEEVPAGVSFIIE